MLFSLAKVLIDNGFISSVIAQESTFCSMALFDDNLLFTSALFSLV